MVWKALFPKDNYSIWEYRYEQDTEELDVEADQGVDGGEGDQHEDEAKEVDGDHPANEEVADENEVESLLKLWRIFMEHFITLVDRTKMTTKLMSLVQGKDEPLREFITRFNKEATTIPNMSQKVALLAMQSGLLPGSPFRAYMGCKSLKTLAEALGKGHKFIKAVETDIAMLSRNAPGDSVKRAKNTPRADLPRKVAEKRTEQWGLNKADDKWQRPPRMVNRNRDTNKWCDFHRDHGHTTEECTHLKDNIEDLVRRGYLNQFKQRDDPLRRKDEDRIGHADRRGGHRGPARDRDRDGKPEGRVYVISGGPVHGGTVNRARADLRAMINQINDNEKRRWPPLPPQPRATFDEYDQKGIIYPHDDSLVVTMRIANWEVDIDRWRKLSQHHIHQRVQRTEVGQEGSEKGELRSHRV
ncbi:uncharacterized protein LOC110688931 [Chenopodium quinoa]|uniref:uncharacterized protein LOC110688931 n=1 Tax=Chenopodium quinoa TaxID=63459 RepID=UPI000B78FBE9|nr:uncharacterized protein LOC110688931 [Chenopodium quinoa]